MNKLNFPLTTCLFCKSALEPRWVHDKKYLWRPKVIIPSPTWNNSHYELSHDIISIYSPKYILDCNLQGDYFYLYTEKADNVNLDVSNLFHINFTALSSTQELDAKIDMMINFS